MSNAKKKTWGRIKKQSERRKKERIAGEISMENFILIFLLINFMKFRALVLHNWSKKKKKMPSRVSFIPQIRLSTGSTVDPAVPTFSTTPNLSWVQCLMVWLSITCMQCVRTVSTRVRLFKMKWVGGWVDGGVEEFSRAGKWSTQIPEFTARCPPNRIN